MGNESEFSRLARKAKRAVFPAKDVNLRDENPRRRSNQAMESLKRYSSGATALSKSLRKK